MKLTNVQTIAGVILLVLLAGFYWYEIRPSNIKKDCYSSSVKRVVELKGKVSDYENVYELCLQKNGL